MPDTNAERQRRWRQRQTGELPPVELLVCETEACGRRHTGAHGGLCWRCWERLTVEGRNARAERDRRWRARKRDDS